MQKSPCRVCLQQPIEDQFIDLLSVPLPKFEEEVEETTFLEMFTLVTEIAMQDSDNSILCNNCQKRLFEAYKFKVEAQNAISYLETIIPMVDHDTVDAKIDDDSKVEEISTIIDEIMPEIVTKRKPKPKVAPVVQEDGMLNRFHCRFCLQYIKGKLRDHEQIHINQSGGLECYHCGKKFRTRKLVLEHIQGVHLTDKSDPNRIRYSCDICGKSYSEKGSLRNHKRDKHSDNPKIVPKKICPYCGEPKKDMLKHIELVHSNKDIFYACDLCDKTYRSKESLRNHQRLAHEGAEYKYQCTECMKCYKTNGELKSHMSEFLAPFYDFFCINIFIDGVHGEDQQLPCETCGKILKSQTTLRFHMKMHRATLDFRCAQCNLGFKTNAYLLKHMKVHSDSKDYVCKFCQMAFKHSGMLSKHVKMHTGEFLYCDQCPSESFIDGYALRLHTERVHLGITYRCDTCNKEYGTKKHLKQHQNAQQHDLGRWTRIVPEIVAE